MDNIQKFYRSLGTPEGGRWGILQIEKLIVQSCFIDYVTHKGSILFKTLHKNEQIIIKKFLNYY
jgi:hypothetical protein